MAVGTTNSLSIHTRQKSSEAFPTVKKRKRLDFGIEYNPKALPIPSKKHKFFDEEEATISNSNGILEKSDEVINGRKNSPLKPKQGTVELNTRQLDIV